VAVVTLGSPSRIFFDPEMGNALLAALTALTDDQAVRVVVVTGGSPGYFVRHYSVAELIKTGERLKSSPPRPERTFALGAYRRPFELGAFGKLSKRPRSWPKDPVRGPFMPPIAGMPS